MKRRILMSLALASVSATAANAAVATLTFKGKVTRLDEQQGSGIFAQAGSLSINGGAGFCS
jgi:hypothetical protein